MCSLRGPTGALGELYGPPFGALKEPRSFWTQLFSFGACPVQEGGLFLPSYLSSKYSLFIQLLLGHQI